MLRETGRGAAKASNSTAFPMLSPIKLLHEWQRFRAFRLDIESQTYYSPIFWRGRCEANTQRLKAHWWQSSRICWRVDFFEWKALLLLSSSRTQFQLIP
jgi:hypothetical protein